MKKEEKVIPLMQINDDASIPTLTFQFVMLLDETTKDDRPQKRMKQKNPKSKKRKLKQDMNPAKKRRKLTMMDHFEIRVSS